MVHANHAATSLRPLAVQGTSKRIWIDLDNTPHVPFFVPIIRELERAGHRVIVTARDAFQVCSLADYHGLAYTKVGRHYGPHTIMKVCGTLWRAAQLLPVVYRERPHISMSHGSRSLVLASAMLRIPTMLLFDYEYAERLPFLRPALGVAPSSIKDPALARAFRYGLRSYVGLKEDVYAGAFRPDPSILEALGISKEEILVTIRPPATEAHYHNREAETLFREVVNFLAEVPGVRMIILPRKVAEESEFIRRTWADLCETGKVVIPARAVDGLNLVWFSDLVVSGGGTMNREAAALNVPVYSIFRGPLGAVDQQLAREGRLVLIQRLDDVHSKLLARKRQREAPTACVERPALGQILEAVYELVDLSGRD